MAPILREKNILSLHIAMYDVELMQILQGLQALSHDSGRLHFRETTLRIGIRWDLSSKQQLCDQVNILMVKVYLVQFDDIWMIYSE